MEKPYLVFCCYAHEDESFLHELKKHLMPLQYEGLIIVQADIDISPGKEWELEVNHYLEAANIILLLISPDFIASHYSFNKEIRQAIVRHQQGTARVVPVIIRPTDWRRMPFGKLQCLPKDAIPISTWTNRDDAFLSITGGIRRIVQGLTANARTNKEDPWWSPAKEDPSSSGGWEEHDTNASSHSSKYIFQNSVQAGIIGENIRVDKICVHNNQKDGILSFPDSSPAELIQQIEKLLREHDYKEASRVIDITLGNHQRDLNARELAWLKFMKGLVHLGGRRPRDHLPVVMQAVGTLINDALRKHCLYAYAVVLAVVECDFAQTGLRRRGVNVNHLITQATNIPVSGEDKVVIDLFACVQPELYRDFRQFFYE